MATVKSLKADVSSVSSSPIANLSNIGLMLETSAFELFTVANLRFQISWYH